MEHDDNCRWHAERLRIVGKAAFDSHVWDAREACFSSRGCAEQFVFSGGRKTGERIDDMHPSRAVDGGLVLHGRVIGTVLERAR